LKNKHVETSRCRRHHQMSQMMNNYFY